MEKQKFKVGDFYRICDRCGEWVPARAQRCDACKNLMQMSEFFEVTEADVAEQETLTSPEKDITETQIDALKMKCHNCDKIYEWGAYTLCPECGGVLVADMHGAGAIEDAEIDEQKECMAEPPCFSYTAYRYSHGRAVAARMQNIPFSGRETILGRTCFTSDPRMFFDVRTEEIDKFYCNISRENAVITQENGRLFVQRLFGKSIITHNGNFMEEDTKIELHDGDLLRFGNGQDKEHMIDICIHRIRG